MKIQIVAEIEGNFILNEPIIVKMPPYEFTVYEEECKRYISVSKPIRNYDNLVPHFFLDNGITQMKLTEPYAYKDMESWLVYIEAMGAFNFDVERINIDELEVKWIYETEEEKGSLPLTSHKRTRKPNKADKVLNYSVLFNLITFKKDLPDASIVFRYYRQAKNFFDNRDYYFAFINYFMMLEFMFADGKFHQNKMISNFKKSKLLELCILSAVDMFKKYDHGANYDWLLNECNNNKNKQMDFDGIVEVLIKFRGLLSHASSRSKQYLLEVEKLRPITLFISLICFMLCGYIQIYCKVSEDSKIEFIIKQIKKIKENNLE